MADASDRIKEHRERQERLEDAAADARAILSQRRAVLDDVNTIAAYAQDMSEFLNESELTERRAFIETFVKEIVVMPGDALLRYTIPMPDDGPIPGRNAEEMVLNGSVLSTVKNGGPAWTVLRSSGGRSSCRLDRDRDCPLCLTPRPRLPTGLRLAPGRSAWPFPACPAGSRVCAGCGGPIGGGWRGRFPAASSRW